MLIEVDRLLKSDTWLLGTGDQRAAAMSLWLSSWHQVPAGSLPAQDSALQSLSMAGSSWKRVRDHALRGWVACTDRRLYHPRVAEVALVAWLMRLEAKLSGIVGNKKLGRTTNIAPEVIREQVGRARAALAALNPDAQTLLRKSKALTGPETAPVSPPVTGPDTPPDDASRVGSRDGSRTQVEVEGKASPPAAAKAVPVQGESTTATAAAEGGSTLPLLAGAEQEEDLSPRAQVFREGRALLAQAGVSASSAGSLLGKLCKEYGDAVVLQVIGEARAAQPAEPKSWLVAACESRKGKRKSQSNGVHIGQQQYSESWETPN